MRLVRPPQTDWEADPVKLVPKGLWEIVLEPESQTIGAQLPKILCMTICDVLI